MSAKNLDKKNRRRNVTVAFRMSEEESGDLNTRVKLSGLTKQDYIIKRLLEHDIVVQGNPRVFKALRNQMTEILTELRRIENSSEISDEFFEILKLTAKTYYGMNNK